ncbi:MAG: S-layer homology domain-containing protein [Oscillospiraceae bacterium]
MKAGSFYEKAVTWGYENGIVNGVTETAFYPNSSVTREQMAAFFTVMLRRF